VGGGAALMDDHTLVKLVLLVFMLVRGCAVSLSVCQWGVWG
jgi:hypothetical protein